MNKNYDVVIAGGGAVGAACAYFLSREKDLKIALVDFKKPGNASRASAGGLWAIGESVGLGCGVIFFKTLSKRINEAKAAGEEAPRMHPHQLPDFFFDFALSSNNMFPGLHDELRENHNIDFKFQETGLKFVMYDEHDRAYADQIASGIPHLSDQVNWLDADQLREEEPYVSPEAIGAMNFTCDHQVSPFLLIDSYTEGARQNGVDLYLNTMVTGVETEGNRVVGVRTDKGTLSCNTMINAAGAWSSQICEWATGETIPVYPVKGQIVLSEKLPKIMRGCISTSDCYIAQKDNGEILIGSTTEEKGYDTTNTLDELKGLAQGASKCLPILKEMNIKRTWAGLRPGTRDEIPILGPMDGIEGYINANGHFRTGILCSAITGQLIDEIVRGKKTTLDLAPFLYNKKRFEDLDPPFYG